MVSKIWDWSSTSVKLSCETNSFLFSCKSVSYENRSLNYHTTDKKSSNATTINGNFSNKIFLDDEIQFTLGGLVNKQNCRFENPQVIEEGPLHPEKVTV